MSANMGIVCMLFNASSVLTGNDILAASGLGMMSMESKLTHTHVIRLQGSRVDIADIGVRQGANSKERQQGLLSAIALITLA